MSQIGDALQLRQGKKIKGARFNYKIAEPSGRGGSGIVYRATCDETRAEVAIKFFLPLYELNLSQFESSVSEQEALRDSELFHRKEIQCLHEIHHPGIVRITDSGSYQPVRGELIRQLAGIKQLPFFVMEFIEGSSIADYLNLPNISKVHVVSMLDKFCDALIYLHEVKQYMHADIRSANILIRNGTTDPVIIDFALYKNFNFGETKPNEETRLIGDWDLFPKDLLTGDPLKRIKETKGTRRELKELCFPGLDLFQVGKLLKKIHSKLEEIFSSEEIMFLKLVEERLLTWDQVKFLNARWVKEQVLKLDSTYSQFMGVDELTPPSSAKITLQLPGKVITISPLIDQLANTHSFRRLRSINQLVFLDIVYPGAGYRRHLHCFRAYSYCAELLGSLMHSAQFRLLFSPLLARQALVMALLHDINHFPFLHIFQEARGEYMRDIDLLDLFCDGQATQDSPSIYQLLEDVNLSRDQFKELILLNHDQLVGKGYDPGLQLIKSMIDSGADVDKLAYLEDDSRFTGVSYGRGVDAERLIASATIAKISGSEEIRQSWHIAYREDGLSAVESLVMARYWMFRSVYWHRTNRAIMAMLLHIIKKLYVDGGANAREFVQDTMWHSEEAVLIYLNNKYKEKFGKDSITHKLLKERTTIYRRLFSIHGASRDQREARLYTLISSQDPNQLEECRKNLTEALEKYLRTHHNLGFALGEDDVLFDLPNRRLDTAGQVFIKLDTGEVRAIEDLPGPVQRVIADFESLAKRMRVFVHPKIAQSIDTQTLLKSRSEMLNLMEEAVPRSAGDQVR